MRTLNVLFKLALYPEGVSDFHYEEVDIGNGKKGMRSVEDDDVFETHLCTQEKSKYVLEELNNIYTYIDDVYKIINLKFEGDGLFSCSIITDITFEDEEEMFDIIKNLLWPAYLHDVGYVFIKNKIHTISLEVDEINVD